MSTPAIEVALARWVRENTDHLSHVGAWLKSIRVGLKYWQETVEIKEGFTFGGHTPKRVGRHKVTRFRSVAEDYFFEISDPGIRRLYLGAMMVVRDWEKSPRDTEAVVERALVIHWLVTNPGSDPSVVGAANTSFPRTEKETIPRYAPMW